MIEGGGAGPPDRHAGAARYHLQQAIVEILRAVVRGHDGEHRISTHLAEFNRHMVSGDAPLHVIVGDAIAELHQQLDHEGGRDIFEQERETIVLRALQVAAEAMATDSAAKGRLSGRQSRLAAAIEHQFLRREMRAREQQRTRPKPATPKGSNSDHDIVL